MSILGKLLGASPNNPDGDAQEIQGNAETVGVGGPDEILSETCNSISNKNSLIWVSVRLNGQVLPSMVDSGANPNCISLRCVKGSSFLRGLEKHPYSGEDIYDAKGDIIKPDFVIKCTVVLGTPQLSFETEFVVMESLPFSCIIGQKTLKLFESWEISNINRILTINKTHVVPFQDDSSLLDSQNKNRSQSMGAEMSIFVCVCVCVCVCVFSCVRGLCVCLPRLNYACSRPNLSCCFCFILIYCALVLS